MNETEKLQWQSLRGWPGSYSREVEVYRAAVPGGWLVGFGQEFHDGGMGGLTFVPDPDHTWDGGSVKRS